MGKINRSKTPYVAVLLSTGAAFLTVVVNYYAPAKVFKFLIDSSGAIALLVYFVIAVSQLRMRKILRADEAKFACGCGFIRGSPGWSSALLPLCW
ncbi:hypothetical protein ACLK2D_13960 [Escherichia coli]